MERRYKEGKGGEMTRELIRRIDSLGLSYVGERPRSVILILLTGGIRGGRKNIIGRKEC